VKIGGEMKALNSIGVSGGESIKWLLNGGKSEGDMGGGKKIINGATGSAAASDEHRVSRAWRR